MRHAYWCAQPTRGGSCDCMTLDCECGCKMTPSAPPAPPAWAGDYITTSRELTYDLAQLLGDYRTDDAEAET